MGDIINISNVDKFIEPTPLRELSDISKIIRKMINIKNDTTRNKQKKTKPYDINDKISLNQIPQNLSIKIRRCHLNEYDVVDDAIKCIQELESSIKSDLYDYYWNVYIDVLSDLNISADEEERIKSTSDEIYSNLIRKIDDQIFAGKQSKIETNKKITYLNAITAYVFYECKFLIPIEGHTNSL